MNQLISRGTIFPWSSHGYFSLYSYVSYDQSQIFSYVSSCIVQENNSFFQSSLRYLFTVSKEFILIVLRRLIDVKGDGTETCGLDIKNYAWVTVNNDFWVTREAICQWFSLVTNYFMSYTLLYVMNTQFCEKHSHVTHFAIVAKDGRFWLGIMTSPQLICDVTRTRDTSIVTLYLSIVLARANCHKGDLH